MGSKTFKISGKNNFLKAREYEQLRRALARKIPVEEYDAKEDSRSDIYHALNESSFLTDKKAVVVWNADHMDEEVATEFVEDPTKGRVGVFIQSDQSRVKKWFKNLDTDKTVEVSKPKRWEIPDWIQDYARHFNLQVPERLAELIQEYVGTELYVIHNELRKMQLFAGEGTLNQEDVEAVLVRHDDVSAFSICEQWGLCQQKEAVEILETYRKMGGQPIGLLHALLSHVEKLFLARSLYDQGDRDGTKIQSAIGIPPFIWRNKIQPQVQSRQQDGWADAVEAILEVDGRIKRGEDPWPLLELFLLEY